jgi:small subunit ribosomal protein S5
MANYTRESEFEEKIVQVNRVSKKTAGGNKIGFSVLVVVGDKNSRVGVGLGKAPSVQDAIKKGANYAKKHLISVPLVETTIPHEVYIKRGAAKVLLKPATKGTGVVAGGAVRAVVEAAGIRDILSKVLGTSNQASNVYATLEALKTLRARKQIEARPPKEIKPTKIQEKEASRSLVAAKDPLTKKKLTRKVESSKKVPKEKNKK